MSPDLFSYYSEVILREADGCRGGGSGRWFDFDQHPFFRDTVLVSSERIATYSGRCQREMQTI